MPLSAPTGYRNLPVRPATWHGGTTQDYKRTAAKADDYDQVISQACSITVQGGPPECSGLQVVYLPVPDTSEAFLQARSQVTAHLPSIKYVSDYRTDGLKTNSRTFGLLPRNTLRHDYCACSSLDVEQPHLLQHLHQLALTAASAYAKACPQVYTAHQQWADDLHAAWRLGQSPWTSGIINANNPLTYHVDSGNFKAGWSAQYTWRGDTLGGLLVFPQMRTAFDLADGSLLLFNGGLWVHGVTPIRRLTPDAVRYSMVLYSRLGAAKCGTPEQEVQRIRTLRTSREAKPRGGPR